MTPERELVPPKPSEGGPVAPKPSEGGWHSRTVQDTLKELGTSEAGLSDQEASQRLQRYGPNEFETATPVSWLKILSNQLKTVVVLLLVAAAVISFLLGDRIEAAAIAVVLIINTT